MGIDKGGTAEKRRARCGMAYLLPVVVVAKETNQLPDKSKEKLKKNSYLQFYDGLSKTLFCVAHTACGSS
jgi:hypothetical protein